MISDDEIAAATREATTGATVATKKKKSTLVVYPRYFAILDEQGPKYSTDGKKFILLQEEGSFYNIYGSIGDTFITAEMIRTISRETGLAIFGNKENPTRDDPIAVGFHQNELHSKWLPMLVLEHQYWVGLVQQKIVGQHPKKNTNIIERHFDRIVAPSTYMMETTNRDYQSSCTATLLCLHLKKIPFTRVYSIGFAIFPISSGSERIQIYERTGTLDQKELAIEDLQRIVHTFRPTQIIWANSSNSNHNSKSHSLSDYLHFSFESAAIAEHHQKYLAKLHDPFVQAQLFKEKFQTEKNQMEFTNFIDSVNLKPEARIALAYLLEFLYETNPTLLSNLFIPQYLLNLEENGVLLLECHAIAELHLHELVNGNKSKRLRPIIHCMTPMGRRLLANRIFMPSTSVERINERLDLADQWLSHAIQEEQTKLQTAAVATSTNASCSSFRLPLIDIEYIYRRMASKTMQVPTHCFEFIEYLEFFATEKKRNDSFNPIISSIANILLKHISNIFDLEWFRKATTTTFPPTDIGLLLNTTATTAATTATTTATATAATTATTATTTDMITTTIIYELQKQYLCAQKEMKKITNEIAIQTGDQNILFQKFKTYGYVWLLKKTTWNTFKSSSSPHLQQIKDASSAKIVLSHKKLSTQLIEDEEKYKTNLIRFLQQWFANEFYAKYQEQLILFTKKIAEMDIAHASAHAKIRFNYVRPIFCDKSSDSMISCKGLRHPLVEQKEKSYITNDIELSPSSSSGLILHGINGIGKSCFMRSVGTVVILAQAGLYIPANSITLVPFHNLFTRIMGNDSILDSKSSFTTEILECKPICSRVNSKTLILGDEMCHGTTIGSGTAIVASILERIIERKGKFVIATHMRGLEQVIEPQFIPEIQIRFLNLERKMEDGAGPDEYGIIVARDLGLCPLVVANAQRKLQKIQGQPETLISSRSRYVPNRIYVNRSCQNCGASATSTEFEEDHIVPRCLAVENPNLIAQVLHESNIQYLCKECHQRKTNQDLLLKRKQQEEIVTADSTAKKRRLL
jgi:DNA mismatch repair protein MutS